MSAPVLRKLAFETIIEEAMHTCTLISVKMSTGLSVPFFAPLVLYRRGNDVFVHGCVLPKRDAPLTRELAQDFEVGRMTLLKARPEDFTPYDPFKVNSAKYRDGVLHAVEV